MMSRRAARPPGRVRLRRPSSGYALLAVLWMLTGVAALVLAISLGSRGMVATARNRIELTRAGWRAEDCLARARAATAQLLDSTASREPDPWTRLDTLVKASPLVKSCPGSVSAVPVGIAIDINEISGEGTRRLLVAFGVRSNRVESMVDALLDWRDSDDVPRPHGAEREWYERSGRSPPRNGPFANVGEVLYVRGFEQGLRDSVGDSAARDSAGDTVLAELQAVFAVEPGRIILDRAPVEVLASLPGFTDETVSRIVERRIRGAPRLSGLLELMGHLSPASADSIGARFAELASRITRDPDAWIVTARSAGESESDGTHSLTATIEVRVVRAGSRAAIVRRRTTP